MNKRLTSEIIKIICIQAAVIIVTVSVIGASVMVHGEYRKALALSQQTGTDTHTAGEKTNEKEEKKPEKAESPYEDAGISPFKVDTELPPEKMLLNTENSLPADYNPLLSEAVEGSGVMLDSRVTPYYRAMYDAAKESGILLTPLSGYRSYNYQKQIFDSKVETIMQTEKTDRKSAVKKAVRYVMPPGSGEHNAGISVDICSASYAFEYTEPFKWLSKHAAEYGFILRYPKGEEKEKITGMEYQPWHYRFVGCEAAREIVKTDITFEEYLEQNKN